MFIALLRYMNIAGPEDSTAMNQPAENNEILQNVCICSVCCIFFNGPSNGALCRAVSLPSSSCDKPILRKAKEN